MTRPTTGEIVLQLENVRGQKLHCATVFVEDGERAVCIVLYNQQAKAVDALRLETRDIEETLIMVRRWIRPRYIERETLGELLTWVTDEYETWIDVLAGKNGLTAWLGSRGRRRIPEIQA
ncbi:MAG: hypothetical protein WC654_06500 [Patescibacteria group bacterium]